MLSSVRKLNSPSVLQMLNFSSNDYLGLAKNLQVLDSAVQSIKQEGGAFGSGSSRLICGTHSQHVAAECKVAKWVGQDSAFMCSSGFVANYALMHYIANDSVVIFDKLVHASIIEGIKTSKAKFKSFRHNNLDHLKQLLQQYSDKKVYVVVESLYSMQGDFADLTAISNLTLQYNAKLIVDESHTIGMFNNDGSGMCASLNIKPFALTFSCGKALGLSGGIIAASDEVIKEIATTAKPIVYSAGVMPLQCALLVEAIAFASKSFATVSKIKQNAAYLRSHLQLKGDSYIVPIVVGDDKKLAQIHNYLFRNDVFCKDIYYPTVAKKNEMLRVSVNASHSKHDIDRLLELIKNFL